MGIADVGNDTNAGFGCPCHAADLAEVGHAHFNDCRLMTVLQPQQCFRLSDLVVQIALCFQSAELGFQYAGDHFLGGRLSHAAGDAHQNRVKFLPIEPCDLLQCPTGVLHHQTGTVPHLPVCDGCHGSRRDRLFHKSVAVKFFPTQCHEQTACRQVTGVCADTGDLCLYRHSTVQHRFQL